jgi:CubicO group peptidase (beta-lactamase class C family)
MAGLAAAPAAVRAPEAALSLSPALDAILRRAVADNQFPGAVLVVGHHGHIVHRRAYGSRALEPRRETMTLDTIFDIASLTKVVATAPALMKLFEAGRFRLNDRVTQYLPEFQGGRSDVTVRDLLTHFSGLRPDLDLETAWSGYETGVRMALAEKSTTPPGTVFAYSDINFILLGEMVRRLSGVSLAEFAHQHVPRYGGGSRQRRT